MNKLLSVLFVGALLTGCGKEDQVGAEQQSPLSPEEAKQWAKWEADPKPYGGIETLSLIRKAKERESRSLDVTNWAMGIITDAAPLASLTNLEELDLSSNLTDVSPLSELTKLKVLDLSRNRISDLTPLASLTNLEELSLNSNQISDVSALAGLTKLKKLRLGFNRIADVSPLAKLVNLTSLYLHKNQITDLSTLESLVDLSMISLDHNPIPEDQFEMLKKALPNCKIIF